MNIIAVIPARGGSKGIPLKNIYPVKGKPLLVYTLEAARESRYINHILVSTDDDQIAMVAASSGGEVVRRPSDISGDQAPTEAALVHALEYWAKPGDRPVPDYIVTLPPTSPLRRAATIDAFIERFLQMKDRYDAMVTVTPDYHDHWVERAGEFSRLFPDAPRRRQERQPLFVENSAIYITAVSALLATRFILGRKSTAFVIDPMEGTDINELLDIYWVEFLLDRRAQQTER